MNITRNIISRNWRPGRAAWAGLLATIVYSILMEGDRAIIGNRFSDTRFIQGLLEGESPHVARRPLASSQGEEWPPARA